LVGRDRRARRLSRDQFIHVIRNPVKFLRANDQINVRQIF
jgi:hypothetical protein